MTDSKYTFAIYGTGLAGQMTALALSQSLPSYYEIYLIDDKSLSNDYDVLYGNLCSPTSYDFHLSLGLTEPDLLFMSDATFSYGTHYQQWGSSERDWVQCFHLSLPVQESVEFHQSLLRSGITTLEPYLVSAQAARRGVFAHPPQDPKIPLSRAEYGYHVSTEKYADAFSSVIEKIASSRIKNIETDSLHVRSNNAGIEYLQLSNGETIEADWFIDCSGPKAALMSNLDEQFKSERSVNFSLSSIRDEDASTSTSARQVSAFDFGWQSKTVLRGTIEKLTLFADENESAAQQSHGPHDVNGKVRLGALGNAWSKNCIAIGHAASLIEPLTTAPMIQLQRDIERLLELIPVSKDDSVERKEFNRRFTLDYEHACLFNDAFYQCDDLPSGAFWKDAKSEEVDAKLQVKITQFESRGLISMFDLEPFNEQDWLILHFGMQRQPARYSRFAERHSKEKLLNWFATIERDIKNIVNKMPPSKRYVSKMLDYLRTQA